MASLSSKATEPLNVECFWLGAKDVPRRRPLDGLVAEKASQRVDLVLERRPRRDGSVAAPESIDHLVLRDGLVETEEQKCQQRALLRSSNGDQAPVALQGQRSECTELEPPPLVQGHAWQVR